MANRVVTKALAGVEDLLLGTGTAVQARFSGNQSITKINAEHIPYDSSQSTAAKIRAGVTVLANVAALQAFTTSVNLDRYIYVLGYTVEGDGGGGLFWLDTSDITSTQDNILIFNPDVLANGRWKRIDTGNQLSADNGDADLVIPDYAEGIQIFATTLSADRTVTLPSGGLFNGKTITVARLISGLYNIDVGGIVTLPAGVSTIVKLIYDGSTWQLFASNTLSGSSTISGSDISTNLTDIFTPSKTTQLEQLINSNIKPFIQADWTFVNGKYSSEAQPNGGMRQSLGDVANNTYLAQGFKVSEDQTIFELWLLISAIGFGHTTTLNVSIRADAAGVPGTTITNGTAIAQPAVSHASSLSPKWTKFVFSANPTVVANTQYHIVATISGAVDPVNYWFWYTNPIGEYGLGTFRSGTAAPAWTTRPLMKGTFKLVTSKLFSISSALFSKFNTVPITTNALKSSIKALILDNSGITNKQGTILLAIEDLTTNGVLFDTGANLDSDRIRVHVNGSNQVVVNFYEEDKTLHTITGTTSILNIDSSIAIIYRAENDGADFLNLYVNGVLESASLTAQSFSLSNAFNKLSISIGAGLALAPIWTQDLIFTSLPSAVGWTFNGGSEPTKAAVRNSKLYLTTADNNGFADAYYSKTTSFNNAVGWAVETNVQVDQKSDAGAIELNISDGTKAAYFRLNPYSLEIIPSTSLSPGSDRITLPIDLTIETTLLIIGKGSDIFIFTNGRLIFNGEGKLTQTSATNSIVFGIGATGTVSQAGEGSFKSLRYFQGNTDIVSSTFKLSEFAYWKADKTDLIQTIYNAGVIQSVSSLAGLSTKFNAPKIVNDQVLNGKVTDLTIGYSTGGSGNNNALNVSSLILAPSNKEAKIFKNIRLDIDLGVIGVNGTNKTKTADTLYNIKIHYDGRVIYGTVQNAFITGAANRSKVNLEEYEAIIGLCLTNSSASIYPYSQQNGDWRATGLLLIHDGATTLTANVWTTFTALGAGATPLTNKVPHYAKEIEYIVGCTVPMFSIATGSSGVSNIPRTVGTVTATNFGGFYNTTRVCWGSFTVPANSFYFIANGANPGLTLAIRRILLF